MSIISLVNQKGGVMNFRKLLSIALFITFTNLFIASVVWGLTTQQIAQKTFPSVVLLLMEDSNGQPISIGSGFFVRDNIVVTNMHVIEGAKGGYAKIVGQKTKYNVAGTAGVDRRIDLALLSIEGIKAPSLPLGNSAEVQVGDEVYAVGNPLGLEGTFSKGIVSGVRHVGSESIFQITSPISPGSSGGPVVNTQGQVIGVTIATFQGGQNLNFAIPVYYLASLLSNIKPVKPLNTSVTSKKTKSVLDKLGNRSTEGVEVGNFYWRDGHPKGRYETMQTGEYSLSLRNLLREPIKNLYCLVIFFDRKGKPIDVDMIYYSGIIPARLAKRVTNSVDESVQKITTQEGSSKPKTKMEFRVLSFVFAE